MKSMILAVLLFAFPGASFAQSTGLSHILEDEAVAGILEEVLSYTVDFKSVNKATTWTYSADFRYSKKVSGMNGASVDVPCSLRTSFSTIGGVAGTEVSPVKAKLSCLDPL